MLTPCTVTLDLALDEDAGTTGDMAEAVALLTAAADKLPCKSLKLAFSTADVEGAEKLEAYLEMVLQDRAYGVTAEITRKSKRGLARKIAPPPPTPIEREIDRAKRAQPAEVVRGPLVLEGERVAVLELPAPSPLAERVLEALYRGGPATLADLAERLHGVEDNALAEAVEALMAEGRLVQDEGGRYWFAPDADDEPAAA